MQHPYPNMDLTLSQDVYDYSSASTHSSGIPGIPVIPYHPHANFPPSSIYGYNSIKPTFVRPDLYPTDAYRYTHNMLSLPYPFQQQRLYPNVPINSFQQHSGPSCLAPSMLFESNEEAESSPEGTRPPTLVSPTLSAASVIAYTPPPKVDAITALTDLIGPTSLPPSPLALNHDKGRLHEVYGSTGKAEMMDLVEAVEPESEPHGRKRSRTAQACEKCRVRKARVSHVLTFVGETFLMSPAQCFGGNPCNRCCKRRLECEFSDSIRQRGPTKAHSDLKPKASRDSVAGLTPSSGKRQRARMMSAELDEEERQDDMSVNELGLDLIPLSDDADAEGEDDISPQTWWNSPYLASSDTGHAYDPLLFPSHLDTPSFSSSFNSMSGPYGYAFPTTTPAALPNQRPSSSSNVLLSYANAAVQIRKEAHQQLAFALGGGNLPGTSPGDDGGLVHGLTTAVMTKSFARRRRLDSTHDEITI